MKFKFLVLTFFIFNFANKIEAQNDTIFQWRKDFINTDTCGANTFIGDIATDSHGNLIVYGSFSKSAKVKRGLNFNLLNAIGGSDDFIAKFDPLGNILFAYGIGSELNDGVSYGKIHIDQNDNIYLCGNFKGTIDFDFGPTTYLLTSSNNLQSRFIAKYDSNGQILLAFRIDGNVLRINDITVDDNNNIYIAGYYKDFLDVNSGSMLSSQSNNMFVIKYNQLGDLIYSHSIGSTQSDKINRIVYQNGYYYISGSFGAVVDLDPGVNSVIITSPTGSEEDFIAKFDTSGNYVFSKIFYGYGSSSPLIGIDGNGVLYVAGTIQGTVAFDPTSGGSVTANGFSGFDIYLARFDNSGNFISVNSYGDISDQYLQDLDVNFNGDVVFSGQFKGTLFSTLSAPSSGFDYYFAKRNFYTGNFYKYNFGFSSSLIGLTIRCASDSIGNIFSSANFNNTIDVDPGFPVEQYFSPSSFMNIYFSKYSTTGSYLWSGVIGGIPSLTLDEKCISPILDNQNNVYFAGTFQGSIDTDFGIGSTILTSEGSSDVFISKYDASGNQIFSFSIGTTNIEYVYSMTTDVNGNLYVAGLASENIDLDPSAVTHLFTVNPGTYNSFIAKYDNVGNFLDAFILTNVIVKRIIVDDSSLVVAGTFFNGADFNPDTSSTVSIPCLGRSFFIAKYDLQLNYQFVKGMLPASSNGTSKDIFDMAIDSYHNIIITGVNNPDNLDFDPGPGVVNLSPINGNGNDLFFAKYDLNGSYIFAHLLAGITYTGGVMVDIDVSDNIGLVGTFGYQCDFDPGPGSLTLNSNFPQNLFFAKYNPNGDVILAFRLGNNYSIGKDIQFDLGGNIIITGNYYGNMDLDPGSGISDVSVPLSDYNSFLSKYDSSGHFIYGFNFANYCYTNGLTTGLNGEIYLSGTSAELGFDADPGSGYSFYAPYSGDDVFLVKYQENICDNIVLVIDSVSNVNCANGVGFASGHQLFSPLPYTYEWNTMPITYDSVSTFNDPGLYSFTLNISNGCSLSKDILIGGTNNLSSFDLIQNLIAGNFRTGFPNTIYVDAFNDGCTPINSQLSLVLDNHISFLSSAPSPDMISGDTLTWNINAFNYDSSHFFVSIEIMTVGQLGDTVHLISKIDPIMGDSDSTNNYKDYYFNVINAYDPNLKYVYPTGINGGNYINKSSELTYTIMFQNVGNTDAININIRDSLDSNLDISTMTILSSSHSMITEITQGNIINFRFDNIYLPDSLSNEPASHGYVVYSVFPYDSIPDCSIVKNTAHIYFDYNQDVKTNTTFNILFSEIPSNLLNTTPLSNLTICWGGSTSLSASGNGIISWFDSLGNYFGNGEIFETAVLYSSVVFYAQNSICFANPNLLEISVIVDTLMDFSISVHNDSLVSNEPNAIFYQWIDCSTGLAISGANNPVYVASSNGYYAVILYGSNCVDTSICVSRFITSEEVKFDLSDKFQIYPNPCTDLFSVKAPEKGELYIFNSLGELVYGNFFLPGTHSLTCDWLKEGIYFIQFTTESKKYNQKMIKVN